MTPPSPLFFLIRGNAKPVVQINLKRNVTSKIIRCGETLGRILLAVLGSTEVIQRRQKAKAKSGREPDALWGTSADLLPPPGLWPGGPLRPHPRQAVRFAPGAERPLDAPTGPAARHDRLGLGGLNAALFLQTRSELGIGTKRRPRGGSLRPSVRPCVRPARRQGGGSAQSLPLAAGAQ